MPDSVLIIDDDPEMCETLVRCLTTEGFNVSSVADSESTWKTLLRGAVDLVLLDLGLNMESGLEVLKQLNEFYGLPVIILTGKVDPVDRVIGLELGADDYITKPFQNRELVARIRAVIRRSKSVSPNYSVPAARAVPTESKRLSFSGIQIDLVKRCVFGQEGNSIALTTAEFNLLVALASTPGKAVSRAKLLEIVHQRGWTPSDRSIDVHILNLRRKLHSSADSADVIVSVRNIGYILAADVAAN